MKFNNLLCTKVNSYIVISFTLFMIPFIILYKLNIETNISKIIIYIGIIIILFRLLILIIHDYRSGIILMSILVPLDSTLILFSKFTLIKFLGIIIFLVFILKSNIKITKKTFDYNLLFFIIWGTISILWSIDKTKSFITILTLINYFILIFVINSSKYDDSFIRIFLNAYILGSIILAIFGIFNYIHLGGGFFRVSGFINQDENLYGLTLGVALVIVVCFLFNARKRNIIYYSIIIIILTIGTVISLSRTAFVAIIISLLILILNSVKNKKSIVYILFFIFLTFSIFHFITPVKELIQFRIGQTEISPTSHRIDIWKVGYNIFKDNSIIGTGLGNFPKSFTSHYIGTSQLSYSNLLPEGKDPHNIYLGIAVELGIVGLILLMNYFYSLFKKIKNIKDNKYRILNLSLLIYVMVAGIANNLIYKKYFWIVIILIYLSSNKFNNKDIPSGKTSNNF